MKKLFKLLPAFFVGLLLSVNFAFAQSFSLQAPPGSKFDYCPNPSIYMNLKRGDTDTVINKKLVEAAFQISYLQKFLKGYYNLSDTDFAVSGTFGRLTQKYVMQFQKENELVASGIVGAMTRAKIATVCGTGNSNQSSTQNSSDISQDYAKASVGTYYEDFNFDGLQDKLVVEQGNGQLNRSFYVQTTSGSYVYSDELTKMFSPSFIVNLFVDRKAKNIVSYSQPVCHNNLCDSTGSKFDIIPNIGLRNIYNINEDAYPMNNTSAWPVPAGKIKVTISTLEQARKNGEQGLIIAPVEESTNYYDISTYTSWIEQYKNRQSSVNNNSVQSINVPGMQKYTDSDFGFSFWYPNTGSVSEVVLPTTSTAYGNSVYINGANTKLIKKINSPDMQIDEVYSPDTSILSSVGAGPLNSNVDKYYFDTTQHLWMHTSESQATGAVGTSAADISKNTMGGLHIFSGYQRFGNKVIVPLSGTNFLVIYSTCNDATDYPCGNAAGSGTDKFNKSVKTILATDPKVAVPVSISEQQNTVLAERKAYLGY